MENHINILMINYFFFFFLLLIITFFTQLSHSLPQPQLPQTLNSYSTCKEQSYNCGDITNVFYPFWGQNTSTYCGAGSLFYLNSNKNVTTILLFSQNFTVLDINTEKYTIKLKRTDLSQNLCSPQFDDIGFSSSPLFHYLPQVKIIYIYFNCPSTFSQLLPIDSICGYQNQAFDSTHYDDNLSRDCERHIQVPAGEDFSTEKNYFQRDELLSGLDKGFEVNYNVSGECLACLGNQEGDCRFKNINDFESSCYYCPDGSHASSTHCSFHHTSSLNLKRKLIVGIAGSAVMVALLMCIIICYIKGKSSIQQLKFQFKTKNDKNIEAFFKEHGALTQKKYKFSEIKKMTNSFKIKLGQGGFGVVYKGKLFNGCPVAVKILNASKRNGEEFINEVASITRTSHVNVVSLIGFCFEGRKKALVYEFMSNGSLDKFIYNKGPETIESLSWDNLHQIAKGIARGLEYLHRGCTTRILHFDIKPHNILLDENFNPKISDFGLAKLCPRKESIISMSDQRGTMGYVAPEVWNRHFGGVSYKSDVYSFGMMLLEMVGGRKNINADASHTSEIYFPHWVYSRLEFESDLRPDGVMDTEEDEIARRMTIVGLWCIQTLPNDRPTMSKVVEMLEVSMNSLKVPPKPLLSSPTRSLSES
ncbi:LEAF RUST 10 DISEASE-RESISTANCE LOCUS RECEPTOR-LIKE PROTEIN KINASE-like 2.4 isoform X2 [Vicia villosa]|uniref:LEAF RUST 10 DISEASE-RESISTANCE LOCUS RECEPTOR-LIKE PROTEIN KINASE-like 2.4 isoform X2 n=1 Tax=Vicia villosa TaxID=3911 RepID=UPI00273AF283|nr:LEAF RUST 10 DISEASE-RESISTANCE LOCUS RECEPTOR-LIKE PROTEIN KINASE-like 2.4 isoform X2 [Vicia villosa]